jgi:polyribonucleotide nucleotidyltransferase
MLDTLGPDNSKRYIHHYNMAPWANGETGRVGTPKRREIGHGALAERALLKKAFVSTVAVLAIFAQ